MITPDSEKFAVLIDKHITREQFNIEGVSSGRCGDIISEYVWKLSIMDHDRAIGSAMHYSGKTREQCVRVLTNYCLKNDITLFTDLVKYFADIYCPVSNDRPISGERYKWIEERSKEIRNG